MKISQKGIDLIKKFEGRVYLTGYLDPVGIPTIGLGHTGTVDGKPVAKGMKITAEKADALLLEDLKKAEAAVNKYAHKYKWSQNEYDALVSFAYNVGSIDQLTAGGTRIRTVIAQKIMLYNKAKGVELAGLTRRRKAEQTLFLTK